MLGRRDVHVALLGPLRVEGDAQEIAIAGPKRRLVLARLAMEPGRVVSTEALIADLWGERPPSAPRVTLQSHVSQLRRALGRAGDAVATGPDGYCLDVPAGHVDAKAFEAAVRDAAALDAPARATALAAALGRWRGPALQGLGDEGWARNEAARLEELRLQAVEDRIAADLELGRARAVVPELSALVQAHPLREHAWIQLMRALSACGRHAEALRAAQDLRRVLADIGLDAGPELGGLEAEILAREGGRLAVPSSEVPAPVPSAPTPRRPRPGALPLVGREGLLRTLDELLVEAEDDGPRFAVLTGGPGVGKSRLVDELAARATERGALVLVGRCDEDVDPPFQPFAEMAAGLLGRGDPPSEDDPRARGLGWLVPDLAPARPRPTSPPEVEQERRFRDFVTWLVAESLSRPLVMVVEDVQWAALPSLLLLRHVLRRRPPGRFLLVMTSRTTEGRDPSPADGLRHDVWSDEAVLHLAVPTLTGEETAELVARWPEARELVAGGDVGRAAQDLWDRTGGNPLFLRELVRHHWESGHPLGERPEEQVGPEVVPQRIRRIVDQRLARLDPATVRMLERASVLGGEIEISILGVLVSASGEDLLAALDEATAAHLLEPVPGAGLVYRFSHALVADALGARLSPARRATIHRDAGRALELAPGRPDVQRLAHHWSQAAGLGETDRAARYLRRAGTEAFDDGAPAVALRHFRRALALMAADEDDRCEVLLEIGEAQRPIAGEDHRSTFLEAAALARERGDVERLARAAKGISRGFVILGPDADDGRLALVEEATAALARSAPNAHLHAQVLGALAGELRLAGRDGLDAAERAVEVARSTGDAAIVVHALATRWDMEFHPSTIARRTETAKDLANAIEGVAVDVHVATRVAWAGFGVALESDDEVGAARALDALAGTAAQASDPEILWRSEVARATWAMGRGDPEAALVAVDAAAALGRELGLIEVVASHAAQSVLLLDGMGRHDELAARLPDLLTAIPAGQAAAALRDATSGRRVAAVGWVERLLGPEGLALPRDATWPFAIAVLARTAAVLGHSPLARAVDTAVAGIDAVRLAHPTYDAGPVADLRALVGPLVWRT